MFRILKSKLLRRTTAVAAAITSFYGVFKIFSLPKLPEIDVEVCSQSSGIELIQLLEFVVQNAGNDAVVRLSATHCFGNASIALGSNAKVTASEEPFNLLHVSQQHLLEGLGSQTSQTNKDFAEYLRYLENGANLSVQIRASDNPISRVVQVSEFDQYLLLGPFFLDWQEDDAAMQVTLTPSQMTPDLRQRLKCLDNGWNNLPYRLLCSLL